MLKSAALGSNKSFLTVHRRWGTGTYCCPGWSTDRRWADTGVDLEHHILPDPIADMLVAMQARLEEKERRLINTMRGKMDDNEDKQYERA
jgi:hypothetical protein